MGSYLYEIGEGVDDIIITPVHSESLAADSLSEAIIKAKAITKERPEHAKETVVRLFYGPAHSFPLWASPVEDIRNT